MWIVWFMLNIVDLKLTNLYLEVLNMCVGICYLIKLIGRYLEFGEIVGFKHSMCIFLDHQYLNQIQGENIGFMQLVHDQWYVNWDVIWCRLCDLSLNVADLKLTGLYRVSLNMHVALPSNTHFDEINAK